MLAATLMFFGLFFAVTLVIDPYGVSPVRLRLVGFNVLKPKRLDIDRLIKPLEVWRYQPRTVFLGTSRIHQSIDPSVLDGTNFAPAYNASVPAVSLGMNISYLEQYARLDPRLKTVFAELFVYNFLGQGQAHTPQTFQEFMSNLVTLEFSSDTLWASFLTVYQNAVKRTEGYEVRPGGFFYYPPGHDAQGTFDGFAAGIWDIYRRSGGGLKLSEEAMTAARDLIAVAKAQGKALTFIATPNHAYSDYYIDQVGAWDVLEEWLKRLSALAPIYSFSQPNDWVYEPVRHSMTYWNDPFHFSLKMGAAMQTSLVGQVTPGAPENFMIRLTPENVPGLIAERRAAIARWATEHPEFVAKFAEERSKAGF
jgi:hypothetical protein